MSDNTFKSILCEKKEVFHYLLKQFQRLASAVKDEKVQNIPKRKWEKILLFKLRNLFIAKKKNGFCKSFNNEIKMKT